MCFDTVEREEYENIFIACINTEESSVDAALITENFTSFLGTLHKLSAAGELLRSKAESGEVEAQYAFAMAQSSLYPSQKNTETWRDVKQSEYKKWLLKAAEQGHQVAIELYIQSLFSDKKLPTKAEHKKGRALARNLANTATAEANKFIQVFDNIPHQENWEGVFRAELNNVSSLSTEQVWRLVNAFSSGRLIFESGFDVNADGFGFIPDVTVRISPSMDNYVALLKYLDEEHLDAEAAYRLMKRYKIVRSDLSFHYFSNAIERQSLKAMATLGAYLVCNQQDAAGKNYLELASISADASSSAYLQELEETGRLLECPEMIANADFIAKYSEVQKY